MFLNGSPTSAARKMKSKNNSYSYSAIYRIPFISLATFIASTNQKFYQTLPNARLILLLDWHKCENATKWRSLSANIATVDHVGIFPVIFKNVFLSSVLPLMWFDWIGCLVLTSLIESATDPTWNRLKFRKKKTLLSPWAICMRIFQFPVRDLLHIPPSSFPKKVLYCKGPYNVLQTGSSLRIGVSLLSGSYPESLHPSIKRSHPCD